MKCNRNCNCNCGSNGGNYQSFNNRQFRGEFGSGERQFSNLSHVFAAVATDPQTVAAATTAPLTLTNILYSYGNAIQAQADTSRIYITQPGLYQVSYFVNATNTSGGAADLSAFILRNTTQIATSTADSVADDASALLADTEIFYVACQDLPLTLSLNVTSTGAGSTYTFLLTINKICSCEGAYNGFGGGSDFPANLSGFFPGCQNFSQSFDGPGPVNPGRGGFDGGGRFGGRGGNRDGCGCNDSCNNNCCW